MRKSKMSGLQCPWEQATSSVGCSGEDEVDWGVAIVHLVLYVIYPPFRTLCPGL